MRKNKLSIGLACLVVLLAAGDLWSQDLDLEGAILDSAAESPPIGFQFNFSNPGARSLGLGGAFVAMADDATAAFANPAGLVQLSQQEVSIEVRANDFTNVFPDTGHAFGEPTGFGVDTVAGFGFGESSTDTSGLSFVSYIYPVRSGLAFAIYRHELANFEAEFQSVGMFFNVPIPRALPGYPKELGKGSVPLRLSPANSFLSLEIENIGVSGAWSVHQDLTLGVGVSLYNFTLESQVENFDVPHFLEEGEFDAEAFESIPFFSAPGADVFEPDNLQTVSVQSGDDDDVGVNAGLLWNINSRWNLGAAYRQGGEFQFASTTVRGPQGEGLVLPEDRQASFHVPDVFAVGVAFRPTPSLRFALDYSLVAYSNLTDEPGAPPFGLREDELAVDDAEEAHLGIEYVLVNIKYPVAFRVGAWNDPDHRVRFDRGFNSDIQGDPQAKFEEDRSFRAASILLQEGPNELHYAFGLGVVVGERFQMDAAIDLSELVDTISLSGVFRF